MQLLNAAVDTQTWRHVQSTSDVENKVSERFEAQRSVEKDLRVDKCVETAISFSYPHPCVSNGEGTFGDFSSLLPELSMTNM